MHCMLENPFGIQYDNFSLDDCEVMAQRLAGGIQLGLGLGV